MSLLNFIMTNINYDNTIVKYAHNMQNRITTFVCSIQKHTEEIKEIVMMPNKKMNAHVHIVDHVVLCIDIQ